MMRASIADRRMFMREVYWPRVTPIALPPRSSWYVAGALLFVQLPIPPTYAGRTIENAGHTPLFFLVTLGVIFVLRGDPRCSGLAVCTCSRVWPASFAGFLSEVIQRPLRSRRQLGRRHRGRRSACCCALAVYALFDRPHGSRARWHRAARRSWWRSPASTIYMAPIVAHGARLSAPQRTVPGDRGFPFPHRALLDDESSACVARSSRCARRGVRRPTTFRASPSTSPCRTGAPTRRWCIDLENPGVGRAASWVCGCTIGVTTGSSTTGSTVASISRPANAARCGSPSKTSAHGPRSRLMDMQQISDITLFRGENIRLPATCGSTRIRLE